MPAAIAASVRNFIIDQTPWLIFLRGAYEAGGSNAPAGAAFRSSSANLPAASGKRSPGAPRARSQGRVDGSYRPVSCRPLRGRGRPCASLLPVARQGRTRTAIPEAGSGPPGGPRGGRGGAFFRGGP